MPQPWLSARQQAYDKIGPAQRKSSIHEAQKQIQHSIGLSLWLKPATEAVEITSVHVTTYPAFRLSDYPTFRDMLCPPQSSSPFVHIYDPKTNKWSIIAADSYRQITGGETSLLLRTIPSLSAPDFDPMEYPGMAEAMQALRRKRSFATVDDLLPMSSNSAGSAKRARLDSESAIAPRAPSPLRICSSPGPGRITEPDEHFPRVSRASLSSDWRALRSGVTGTIPSNNLPTIDEELVTEGTESSMGRSASVGSPEPSMSSGASTTDVPAPASATLSVPTIPTGFKARSYGSDDLSFPKSLPFTDIYNGLVKVHNLTSQRVPQVGRASACSLAWPKYEWQKKRCKGYDDARADLGRGDADIWQRCLNTPNALWGDYTRYLGTLGRSSAKPLHFPWDPDGGRPSQPSADTEPEASEPPTSSESVKTTILSPPSTVVAQANQLLSSISDVAQANDTSPPSHARAPSEPPPPPMIAQGNDSPPASPPAVDELPSLQITWASEPPPPSQNPGNEVLSPPMIVQTNDPLPPTMLVAQMSESLPSLQIAWASEPPPLMLAQAELPSLPTIAQTKNPLPPPSMVELLASDNPLQHINPTYPSFDPEVPSWDAAAPTCTAYYGPSGWYPVLDTIAPSSIESYTGMSP
ncbi:uncharacterized protein C8Q71DRAFT_898628 [Rhodofomes roseus]|uniref:Uncharacterized protein n=1 Tax=Rhodofomes roseus TaxID=34475 RepID=A0ABQ8KIU4_9APHY|nr:uncharacterized protein C8Q71DRAFT_898628 [Rhodofomes roseus]KAH9837874.1 hypothetical protein C8Q71DRAFT_898628 [Rhodofomes roseus]